MNPLELSIILPKMTQNIIRFSEVLKVDKENPIKQVREKYFLCNLFIKQNDPVLHLCGANVCESLLSVSGVTPFYCSN